MYVCVCVYVYLCVCARACVRACVRAHVRACERVCERASVRACILVRAGVWAAFLNHVNHLSDHLGNQFDKPPQQSCASK